MVNDDLILIGRILGAFGIKGTIKVSLYSQSIEFLQGIKKVYIGPNFNSIQAFIVIDFKKNAKNFLLNVEEIGDRGQAEKIKGFWLYLTKENFPPLFEGEYYYYQLKKAIVSNVNGNKLGEVKKITKIGSYDLLLVKGLNGQFFFIPVVEGIILAININIKQIIVDLPVGFIEVQG